MLSDVSDPLKGHKFESLDTSNNAAWVSLWHFNRSDYSTESNQQPCQRGIAKNLYRGHVALLFFLYSAYWWNKFVEHSNNFWYQVCTLDCNLLGCDTNLGDGDGTSEEENCVFLWVVGIILQDCMVPQPRKPQYENSLPWKSENLPG